MKHTNWIAISLLAALAAGTMSCGGDTPGTTETTAAPEPTLAEKFTPEMKAELGLDGYEFNVFLREKSQKWSNRDVYAAEQNGEVLNDAVYSRNMFLEDTYGFKLKVGYSAKTQADELGTMILAGDDTYDAAFPMGRTASSIAQTGGLVDLHTLKYLDLDSDVWNRLFTEKLTLNGKLYYATGDIAINAWESLYVIMFNKGLTEQFKLESPYDLVSSGKWTLDKFGEMCAAVAADVNGDQKMDMNDRWGLATQESTGGLPFYYGTGELLADNNDGGVPIISVGSERSFDAFEAVKKLLADKSSLFLGATADALKLFEDGQALFYNEVMYQTMLLRASDVEFGVLPMPKMDEAQTDYYSYENGWCLSPAVIPVTAKDPERSGFVLQAMAEASREFVRPAYYDLVLVSKNLRDDESAAMLDVIFGSFVLDPTDLYSWSGMTSSINTAFTDGDLASLVASEKSKFQEAIDKTVAAFK